MKNNDIRVAAKAAGVMLWQIAEALGIPDTSFSKILRRELPPEKKTQVMAIISELSNGSDGR